MKFIKILMLFSTISIVFCKQPAEEKKQVITTTPSVRKDTTLTGNYATSQISLNVETLNGHKLAFTTLDIVAFVNKKGKYKVKTVLIDNTENGAFSSYKIVDKAVISIDNKIQVMITYELQAERIIWNSEQGELTGVFNQKSPNQPIKSEGGSTSAIATIIFDAKTMNLISQGSVFQGDPDLAYSKPDSDFQDYNQFARKHLKLRLSTAINWVNPSCQTNNCSTGQIFEQK